MTTNFKNKALHDELTESLRGFLICSARYFSLWENWPHSKILISGGEIPFYIFLQQNPWSPGVDLPRRREIPTCQKGEWVYWVEPQLILARLHGVAAAALGWGLASIPNFLLSDGRGLVVGFVEAGVLWDSASSQSAFDTRLIVLELHGGRLFWRHEFCFKSLY